MGKVPVPFIAQAVVGDSMGSMRLCLKIRIWILAVHDTRFWGRNGDPPSRKATENEGIAASPKRRAFGAMIPPRGKHVLRHCERSEAISPFCRKPEIQLSRSTSGLICAWLCPPASAYLHADVRVEKYHSCNSLPRLRES